MQTVDFNRFRLNPGDRVLDLGCGEGRHTINTYLHEEVNVTGVDLCFDDLRTAREKASDFVDDTETSRSLALSCSDALKLPFRDSTFDKVICSEVLEHIPDWEGALGEIHRVLKPGGHFAASVPRYGPEKICWFLSDEYHANEGGHIRIFREAQLRKAIECLGLSYQGRHWAHALHSPYWWLKCALWEKQEESRLVQAYHKLLVWDMMSRPALTRTAERILNPLIGKSVVMYFEKGALA